MSHAEYLTRKIEQCRRLAGCMTDEQTVRALHKLATDFEREAAQQAVLNLPGESISES
jgi:hypothetical protein